MSPALQMNGARYFEEAGDYARAEAAYTFAVEGGYSQRRWLDSHWQYAQFCNRRGEQLWLERESAKALGYFLKAQELLEEVPRGRHRQAYGHLETQLESRIGLLRATGFTPE